MTLSIRFELEIYVREMSYPRTPCTKQSQSRQQDKLMLEQCRGESELFLLSACAHTLLDHLKGFDLNLRFELLFLLCGLAELLFRFGEPIADIICIEVLHIDTLGSRHLHRAVGMDHGNAARHKVLVLAPRQLTALVVQRQNARLHLTNHGHVTWRSRESPCRAGHA